MGETPQFDEQFVTWLAKASDELSTSTPSTTVNVPEETLLGGFFTDRRKLGCVTLVMACGVTSDWIRSFDYSITIGNMIHLEGGMYEMYPFVVPCWLLAIPLTMLSAYLIICQPRRARLNRTV